jgi:F-type H+-transporting ATPase subunit epsilon
MAKSKDLILTVITPERQVLDETTTSVVLPAHDGELGVLRNRAPLMAELGVGQLRYTHDGRTRRMFIDGGFTQVLDNRVTVLTPQALPAEEITAEVVAAAQSAVGQADAAPSADERRLARRRLSVLRALRPSG